MPLLEQGGCGRVDGDGYDDLVVGCQGIDTVYTLFSLAAPYTDIALGMFSSSAITGFTFTGSSEDGTGGMPAGGGGDFNSDGYADVFVGAPYHDESGRQDCGAVYLVFGHMNSVAFGDVDANTGSVGTGVMKIIGAAASELSGYWVNIAGDVNGDGFDDIVIGAIHASPFGRTDAGTTYVIFGYYIATTYHTIDLASLASSAGFNCLALRHWQALESQAPGPGTSTATATTTS